MLEMLKREANITYTENGAVTYESTGSDCLDLFAGIGALRAAPDDQIVTRFMRAYAENADLAVKTLFFARDIRGGLGERRTFRVILRYLADHEPVSCRKNLAQVAEFGRFDDLLCLFGTACEADMLAVLKAQLLRDLAAVNERASRALTEQDPGNMPHLSLLAKWLPSVNASSRETVLRAKKTARAFGMTDEEYRKTLARLRAELRILENYLRERDYSFDYEAQPSRALLKYRAAFLRNDPDRYRDFLNRAAMDPSVMHTGTLAPYDIIAPVIAGRGRRVFSEDERRSLDVTWNAQEDFTGSENALVVVDGSGSMYAYGDPCPAAVAQSLGIYFAERNTGRFHNHFITFSHEPHLVEVKGRDIVDKVRYCMRYNDVANTDLAKVFSLILRTAVKNRLPQAEMPAKLYIISDMEFDYCCTHASLTNFEYAKQQYASCGYRLPQVVFWNVQSRNRQQPVTMNEQGAVLVSGASPAVFSMLRSDTLDPYSFMMQVLGAERYTGITA